MQGIIDPVLVGNINADNLADLVNKTRRYIGRKIRILVMTRAECKKYSNMIRNKPNLILWVAA